MCFYYCVFLHHEAEKKPDKLDPNAFIIEREQMHLY